MTENDRKQEIQQEWQKLRAWLKEFNGLAVSQRMDALFDEDQKLWNALYWYINRWLVGFFCRKPMTEHEAGLGLSEYQIGQLRFRSWWYDSLKKTAPWSPSELPHMMQELRKEA